MVGPVRLAMRSSRKSASPVAATSIVTVMAVSEVLACCPPGPPERVAIHETESGMMASPRGVCNRFAEEETDSDGPLPGTALSAELTLNRSFRGPHGSPASAS